MSEQPVHQARKVRSPSYPSISLATAIERAEQLYLRENRHPAPVHAVLHHWNYSPKSGPGFAALSSVKQYGLIDDLGRGDERQIRLADLGLQIVQDRRPDSSDRANFIREAALRPTIYCSLWEQFGSDGSDHNLTYYLTRHGYTDAAATDVVQGYRDTIEYAKLTEVGTLQSSGVTKAEPHAGVDEDHGSAMAPRPSAALPEPHRPKETPGMLTIPVPLDDGQLATLQIPVKVTPAAWGRLMLVLNAYKPGLVDEPRKDEDVTPAERDQAAAAFLRE
jgi:hypothetical protein